MEGMVLKCSARVHVGQLEMAIIGRWPCFCRERRAEKSKAGRLSLPFFSVGSRLTFKRASNYQPINRFFECRSSLHADWLFLHQLLL